MLRGFRWQLLALVVAAGVFALSFAATRLSDSPDPEPTASPQPTEIVAEVEAAPTDLPEDDPVEIVDVDELIEEIDPVIADGADGIVTYREALVGEIRRLNPLLVGLNPAEADVTSLIFEGLTTVNEYGEVQPLLAEEWFVSFDGLEYVFILRDDVFWQDGTPFTAADVVYTMSLLAAADFPGPERLGAFWQTVETQRIDDYTIRFRLSQQLGSFPEALRVGILPYHALQRTTAAQLSVHPFNLSPVGTGPYQLESLRGSSGRIEAVDLRVSPVYRQRPGVEAGFRLERISFYLYDSFEAVREDLRTGEVDGYAARDQSERLALLELAGMIVPHTSFEPTVGMVIFNWVNEDMPAFREQRVRQALEIGLNRTSIIERHFLNIAVRADSPLPPLSWAYNGGLVWPVYDQAEARNRLETVNIRLVEPEISAEDEEADATVDAVASDALFSFSILTLDTPAQVNAAQEIASQWSQLNLDVTVEAVGAETYRQRLENSEFDAALVELSKEGSADPDVYPFWHEGQYPDGQNYGGVNDRVISEALERARRDASGTNRSLLYKSFQQEFVNRAIAIPLYYPLYTYAVTPRLQGVQLGFIAMPQDRFQTIGDWHF